ncbi:Monocarboxylate 2-oxoacid-binding periplasmic protein precursor [Pseudovibrio axinellae]|uniref:Monocarboxylate 2-oxoacid-binding periplasmic protein n=1 Tax=Pseudovibrio axinellae TaxID=989403 RepID=A0A166APR3_9HYPH|nr:TRAP transporter substrate-binding protein [Pseudovibrio axinellae]KZL21396.1 Monocarboxylate 2-oxoacid-binding periplasmic protein precursor [Pseudovibrio axinellae]SEQ98643.1 TRAP-type mannitol/chloroaromatic compound transport system, substrate-binding protein [Pseudovibrio axinellae]
MIKENEKNLTRRQAFGLAAGAVAGGAALAAPAVAQSSEPVIEWRMVTSWPKNLPGPGMSAQRICDRINMMSNGRMRVRLFAAGELVPAFEVFDAVSSGTAQMGHSAAMYWAGKMPASVFFTTVPFGLLPHEHTAWIDQLGGQQLWDELYAPFGVKPFMGGNTGPTMAGWYREPVETLDDLKGRKLRMAGLGGEVMRKLGVTPVNIPASEIFTSLQTHVVDGVEFLGPWSDSALGFQKLVKYYYGPGFNKPNGTGEGIVNAVALEGLPLDLQAVVENACRVEADLALSEANAQNAASLKVLQTEHSVEIREFPEDVLSTLKIKSEEVLDVYTQKDKATRNIYESYIQAKEALSDWSALSLGKNISTRA